MSKGRLEADRRANQPVRTFDDLFAEFRKGSGMTDEEREAEKMRMQATLDGISKGIIFRNARRICAQKYKKSPNWVLAMNLFGLGSTYAFALCRQIGVNPDSSNV